MLPIGFECGQVEMQASLSSVWVVNSKAIFPQNQSMPEATQTNKEHVSICVFSRNIPRLQDGLAEFLHLLEWDSPPAWTSL